MALQMTGERRCGRVTFEVAGAAMTMACRGRSCQRMTGGPFSLAAP